MKKLLWITLLTALPLMAELSIKKIDKMVQQIQGKRESRVQIDFDHVSSPFAIVVPKDINETPVMKTVRQTVAFNLDAIVNDRARINGHWVGVGDSIQGYRIVSVEDGHVILKKAERKVELFLPNPTKTKLFQINEG